MKKITVILSALAFILCSFLSNAQDAKPKRTKLAVDVASSKIHWLAKKIAGQHEGNISLKNGSLAISPKGKLVGGSFTIDMNSIVCTDIDNAEYNKKFIGHITTGDFFETDKFPTAVFVITKFDGTNITGNLTMHGVTKAITFPAKVTASKTAVTATATIPVDRTEFGVKYGSKKFFDSIGDKAIDDVFTLDVTLVSAK
ncbi:MAG: YceI family protein [Pseudarcicella sp.]|nr:YceI family protein [Pseudarcicella sp.]MBP6410456.1 YceI family protein [Pseudarcicella sp.]